MILDRTLQPPILPITRIPLPQVEKSSLRNGIPLHLIRDDAQEVLRLDFMIAGGSWHQYKPLVSFFTNQMLKEGSVNLNSQQIAEKLDFYGSSLQLSSSYHYSYLTIYSLTKYVKETLAVVEDILKRPSFPQAEFEVLLNKRKQHFLLDEEKVQNLASKRFSECIYGLNHPYGRTASLADFDNISMADITQFHQTYYGSRNIKLVLAGNITQAVLSEIETLFGKDHWGLDKLPTEPQFKISSELEKKQFVPKAASVQSAVRIGRVGLHRNHPDFHGMKVVSMVLGGYFGSRLMSSIREEKGYTYGIGSSLSAMRDGGTFCITTETATEHVKPLIAEVYKEMNRLCTEPVGEDELMMVKNFMLGDSVRLFDGTFSIADACISLLANDMEISFYEKQIQTIHDINSSQIQSLAKKYFEPEVFYEIVAGAK